MSDDQDVQGKIIDFLKHAKGKSIGNKQPSKAHSVLIENSTGVIVGDNAQLTNIVTRKIINRTIVKRTPGDGYISDEQAAELTSLVHDIVDLEKILKKKPRTYAAVWSTLFRRLLVTKRDLIPLEKYDDAISFLIQQKGMLTSMPSARKHLPDWRKRKYAYVHMKVKEFDLEQRLREHLIRRYGVFSLTELDDYKLEAVYRLIGTWSRRDR
jgi:hypothetical protein